MRYIIGFWLLTVALAIASSGTARYLDGCDPANPHNCTREGICQYANSSDCCAFIGKDRIPMRIYPDGRRSCHFKNTYDFEEVCGSNGKTYR